MQKIVNKYKNMNKEDKKELLKKIAIGTGLTLTGVIIGKKLKNKEYEKDISYLYENLECLESDNFYLEEVIDRQTLRMKELIDDNFFKNEDMNSLREGIIERDLSIMELVDGNTDRYRGIRSNIYTTDELINNSSKLDAESTMASINYQKYLKNKY